MQRTTEKDVPSHLPCSVSRSINLDGDHTSQWLASRAQRSIISNIDGTYRRHSKRAKSRSANVVSTPHNACRKVPHSFLRLISCQPTPCLHTQTAIGIDAPYTRLSIGWLCRASKVICMLGCVDQQRLPTSSYRAACMPNEALCCSLTSRLYVAIVRSTRVSGLLALAPPTTRDHLAFRSSRCPRNQCID